jgi:hypothetical protein
MTSGPLPRGIAANLFETTVLDIEMLKKKM